MTKHDPQGPQFFLTAPTPCPYLPGRRERKVFTHLVGPSAPRVNDVLSHGGFRRSQSIAYRPACEGCNACVSVRVLSGEHEPTRNQRRVLAANADLVGETKPAKATSEQYSLFRSYVTTRHSHGGMAEMSALDYAMMIDDSHVETTITEYRRRGPDSGITGRGAGDLVAFVVTDALRDGLSLVYSAFDPQMTDRSLGTFLILDHIRRARLRGLPYLYLGYWVDGSPKMDYKRRFKPQERLSLEGWERV